MKPQGLLLIAIAILVPLLWLPGIAPGRDLIALLSQYIGMVALIVMALAQIIATRWPGVEATFGPLDQSYRLHKWLGISGLAAILLHDTIDADMRNLGAETALNTLGETLGEISLYGFIILVVITIATFIPYRLWKWTHRLIGIFFVLGAAHFLLVLKPFKNADPLGLYMAAICALGTLAYLYTSAPRAVRPARRYQITDATPTGTALAIQMAPIARPLHHRAGQFGFFTFDGAGLPEPHPFTISSAPREDGSLRVTIAPLGDLTSRLAACLDKGQTLRVEGPFGHFGRGPSGPQVWIAAGVGITPMLALAEALKPTADPVTLIYSARSRDEAPHLADLEAIAQERPNLSLIFWESQQQGRLDADQIAGLVPKGLSQTTVLFCGPSPLRRALATGLARHGVSAKAFHYEEFEIRTGLGLRRLFQRIR